MYTEQALEQGVDGMILAALHEEDYIPVIDKAVEAGVDVVTVHSDAPKSRRKAYCGPNYDDYARKAAYWLAEAIGGKGEVGVMMGNMSGTHEPRIAGYLYGNAEEQLS